MRRSIPDRPPSPGSSAGALPADALAPGFNPAKISSTSQSVGKRPASALEKIARPSTNTSNWPVLPGLISASSPKRLWSDAARLAARVL
jgi:hypothetical protein